MRFLPHVTVATIVEHQSRFLMVEEKRDGRIVLNQPAGHLEADETLLQAARRETLEETAWHVELGAVIGIYLFQAANGETYQRVCFSAKPISHDADRPLDEGIIRARWMTLDEIVDNSAQLRSHLVADCIRDYLNKPHYSLDLIR
ncbi:MULTISPECIES: NUDIX hydrolase [Pseudomonas]|jgi:ADP-ribose pyrophosphatase YjhB (NUDIX family)|uniref:Phosphatase NudJ n=1 Tax=Pseudomonas abyssi TaxID=170540 RepID=A0A2A3MED7_9PSED|nr:NUDIX hydrolase [Pseudomonas abyssi]MAC99219.1 NUDIX hydrolase [Pseudomonadales bacterium]MAG67064.1 NUDIX hydrolase [Pseudomonadales bacterium]PBK03005.1 NUDIX hydrolase [Pseudomonas abyssi]|tara:strand:+ start:26023 stop:26457 length:435 start_codon:yes stop_codon:yes gene_type:complete